MQLNAHIHIQLYLDTRHLHSYTVDAYPLLSSSCRCGRVLRLITFLLVSSRNRKHPRKLLTGISFLGFEMR
jgi:hypothetical protein